MDSLVQFRPGESASTVPYLIYMCLQSMGSRDDNEARADVTRLEQALRDARLSLDAPNLASAWPDRASLLPPTGIASVIPWHSCTPVSTDTCPQLPQHASSLMLSSFSRTLPSPSAPLPILVAWNLISLTTNRSQRTLPPQLVATIFSTCPCPRSQEWSSHT